jgi:hypothetical protein
MGAGLMAASKALFDVHVHLARAAGRLPRIDTPYEPMDLVPAVERLSIERRNLRHSVAASLLSSQVRMTPSQREALFENLVPEACRDSCQRLDSLHQEYGSRRRIGRSAVDPQPTDDELHPMIWIPWEPVLEVSFDSQSVTARAWCFVSKPLEEIAPKLDPQNWDAGGRFIDAAFGISRRSNCNVDHRREIHEVRLGCEFENQVLHEEVSASSLPIPLSLSCDLNVTFRKDFGSPVPNHVIYELRCNHQKFIDRNEGHCYVREVGDRRLVYCGKHVSFIANAPPLLPAIAAILLPEWLQSTLQESFS